jgi:sugar/nucleoside kinase (ribokinase family)
MLHVMVAGHVCVDLIPELEALPEVGPGGLAEVGPLAAAPGGAVANTGSVLAGLGADVAVAGDAGDDDLGALLETMLAARGLDTSHLRRRAGETTSYSLVLEAPGRDRAFWHHIGANAGFDGAELPLAGLSALHIGYPSLLPALTADGGVPLAALFERARAAGAVTSLDLAVIDPASPAARLDWRALLERVLPQVDVVSPSVEDVRSALGLDGDLVAVARELVAMGAGTALLTAGADGLALCTAGFEQAIPPREAGQVRTTLAAGDAGALWGMLCGCGPGDCLALAAETAAALVSGQRPEEPKPFAPRPSADAGSSATTSTGGVRHGTSTSWAIRSPGSPS